MFTVFIKLEECKSTYDKKLKQLVRSRLKGILFMVYKNLVFSAKRSKTNFHVLLYGKHKQICHLCTIYVML